MNPQGSSWECFGRRHGNPQFPTSSLVSKDTQTISTYRKAEEIFLPENAFFVSYFLSLQFTVSGEVTS